MSNPALASGSESVTRPATGDQLGVVSVSTTEDNADWSAAVGISARLKDWSVSGIDLTRNSVDFNAAMEEEMTSRGTLSDPRNLSPRLGRLAYLLLMRVRRARGPQCFLMVTPAVIISR